MLNINKNVIDNETKRKIKFFDNDDDFYAYAVIPTPVLNWSADGKSIESYSCNFTDAYNDDCECGITHCIRDPKSKIMKRNNISFLLITKPLTSLERPYHKWLEQFEV